MTVTTIGLDIAKNVFQLHGVDEKGRVALRKRLRRDQLTSFFANLPACIVGIEATQGAYYCHCILNRWAIQFGLISLSS